jgi:hypothetical protein
VRCEYRFYSDAGLYDFNNSLCNIHAQGVANALPLAALTEGATIRCRVRVMGVGKTLAAKHSRTSGCTLQDCQNTSCRFLRQQFSMRSLPMNTKFNESVS